ncbi:signal recognition particle-docking protein FtsY [Solidesulfovibrio sp. C21]|uniref:signal recognition particle-docking protein FtsY n=1 Tax=Solidesulfovibrio sp. C21 TaxID=3398613 RepID=UPI0039FD0A19
MGFFSKIKKFWKTDEETQTAATSPEETDTPETAPSPEPAAAMAEKPAAPIDEAVAPEPEAPEATAGPGQPVIEPKPTPVAPPAQPAAPEAAPQAAKPIAAESQASTVPGENAPWRDALILELRQAEPKLSAWLDILLADVTEAGPDLWDRLRFLFASLQAPADEADAFVAKFADWVALMEYDEVELFRSELQYRLALALDLEDEEDERNRLFLKLSEGLAKTKEQIVKRIDGLLGNHAVIDEAFWEELEEILIMADVGYEPAAKLMDNLREKVRKRGTTDPAVFKDILREELAEIFQVQKTIKAINPPEVVMMIGVNGVGKTTTIAKLAHRDIMQGKKVLIAAGDTFRAAAIEQLKIWADRAGASFYTKGENADPAAVAFEAMDKALAEGFDVLYLDTAGRLHTKANLMEELKKIRRVVSKKHPGAPHRSVLVLDATTGQNALSQTKLFNEAAGVDEIILTKLDGTAKGGVVVGIALSFGVPITYVGLGEKMEDLRPFVGQDFAQALLGVE